MLSESTANRNSRLNSLILTLLYTACNDWRMTNRYYSCGAASGGPPAFDRLPPIRLRYIHISGRDQLGPWAASMNERNYTLQTAEQLIRQCFPGEFGERYSIDHIVGSSFARNGREVNYITVYLAPGGPPLDQWETSKFDILLKEMMIGYNIRDWPAIAFVTQDRDAS